MPYLVKQIKAIRPQVIVTLGKVATHALLGSKEPISLMRGHWQRFDHIRVMPTFPSLLSPQISRGAPKDLGGHATGDGVSGGT